MASDSRGQLPLKGAVICCTSITQEERARLAKTATEMGADHKYDLTSDVTHLIVGAVDTPKYRYVAKERPDVKVLKPEWIDAVREQWLTGNDVDVAALEETWKAPPFIGLKISLTGFDDLEERSAIANMVQAYGAQYSGDLTRDMTHLVVAAPKGKKYEYARSWGVKTITLRWMHDSVARGLALDEALYDPLLPPDQQGLNAWKQLPAKQALNKRSREDDAVGNHDGRKRKLRRTASQKLGSQTGTMWAEIKSVRPEDAEAAEWDSHEISHDRVDADDVRAVQNVSASTLPPDRAKRKGTGMFQGRAVCVLGFDERKTRILREALSSHGAVVILEPGFESISSDQRADGFLVLPYDVSVDSLPISDTLPAQRVTELWIELCVERRKLVDPDLSAFNRSLNHVNIAGFKGILFNSTSYEGIELKHLTKVIELLGGSYSEVLNAQVSVIISKTDFSVKQNKVEFAVQQGIPLVTHAWLEACLTAGKVLQPSKFIAKAVSEKTNGYKVSPEIEVRRHAKTGSNERPPDHGIPDGNAPKSMDEGSAARGERQSASTSTTPLQRTETNRADPHLPLQELAPEMNSPARRSRSASKSQSLSPFKKASAAVSVDHDVTGFDENLEPHVQEDLPFSATNEDQGVTRGSLHSVELNNAISVLLAQRQASRPSSARDTAARGVDRPQTNQQRRRAHRVLGRALSATSTGSIGLSRTSSLDQPDARLCTQTLGPATQALQQGSLQPSQALVWQDPIQQRHKEDLIERLGGKAATGTSVYHEEVKVLRDIAEDSGGVGSRVRRRAREGRAVASGL